MKVDMQLINLVTYMAAAVSYSSASFFYIKSAILRSSLVVAGLL